MVKECWAQKHAVNVNVFCPRTSHFGGREFVQGCSDGESDAQAGMSTSTLKDIAQLAGVSTATASRVINGSHRGSSQVRIAVMRAVSALRYIPNPHATQLGRSNGGRKRTRHKERRYEPDAIAVRA